MALEHFERSICDGCGMSVYLTKHADFDGHFTVTYSGDCLACAAVGRHQDKQGNKHEPPGRQYGIAFNDDYRKAVTDD